MVADLLHRVALFLRGLECGIVQHAIHGQAVIDVDGRFLADDGAVHVEGGDAVRRIKIIGAGGIGACGHKGNQFPEGRAVRIPGREQGCVIDVLSPGRPVLIRRFGDQIGVDPGKIGFHGNGDITLRSVFF